jgi:hypothetical protein
VLAVYYRKEGPQEPVHEWMYEEEPDLADSIYEPINEDDETEQNSNT